MKPSQDEVTAALGTLAAHFGLTFMGSMTDGVADPGSPNRGWFGLRTTDNKQSLGVLIGFDGHMQVKLHNVKEV